jgi:hypothetical protein
VPQCGIYPTVVFIESRAFNRRLLALGNESSEKVLSAIQADLLDDPERGRVVQGLGGIRKARAADPGRGKGKRGGLRYLYLYVVTKDHIHLLHLFDKDEQEDLEPSERDDLRRLAAWIKGQEHE